MNVPMIARPSSRPAVDEDDFVTLGWLLDRPFSHPVKGDCPPGALREQPASVKYSGTPGARVWYRQRVRAIPRVVWVVLSAAFVLGPTMARGVCPAVPRAACRAAGQVKLTIRNGVDNAQDKIVWAWSRGEPTRPADFGNPLASTGYSLCLWNAAGLVFGIDLPPGGVCGDKPCWSSEPGVGWRFHDSARATGIQSLRLAGSTSARAKISVAGRGPQLPDPALPLGLPATVQLLRDDAGICFEGVVTSAAVRSNTPAELAAKASASTGVPVLASAGCGQAPTSYPPGLTTADSLSHGGLTRTFRVHVPASYDASAPQPVVLLFHGGFGSGAQVEASARIVEVAEAQGFIAVSPDGVLSPSNIRTWNGGTCCGYAVAAGVDDVGFVAALVDRLEAAACIDRRRVYATGMSNGAILAQRLGCDLADRIRAIGPVAGTDMTTACAPLRVVPIMEIHGTADVNVPYQGGLGCGAAGVLFTSVPETIARWRARGGCSGAPVVVRQAGDTTCREQGNCASFADVILCDVQNGGHTWPGGTAPLLPGLGDCLFGNQSQTFVASQELWGFFAAHPPR